MCESKHNQEVCAIETYNFRITDRGDGSLWIERTDGEGMQVTKEDFDRLIEKFYRDNF